jgi:gas vesicle protein
MESSDRQESGTLSAFITGALVGAGVALLFAPQAGSQMRALLRDYAARGEEELESAVDRGADAWDRGQEFVEKGKESLREAGRQAQGFAEAGIKTVSGIKDELSSQHR